MGIICNSDFSFQASSTTLFLADIPTKPFFTISSWSLIFVVKKLFQVDVSLVAESALDPRGDGLCFRYVLLQETTGSHSQTSAERGPDSPRRQCKCAEPSENRWVAEWDMQRTPIPQPNEHTHLSNSPHFGDHCSSSSPPLNAKLLDFSAWQSINARRYRRWRQRWLCSVRAHLCVIWPLKQLEGTCFPAAGWGRVWACPWLMLMRDWLVH